MIEVVVAVSLISLIALTLGSVATGTTRMFVRGHNIIERDTQILLARNTLTDLLTNGPVYLVETLAKQPITKDKISWIGGPTTFSDACSRNQYTVEIIEQNGTQRTPSSLSAHLNWQCLSDNNRQGSHILAENLPPIIFEPQPLMPVRPGSTGTGHHNIEGIWVRGCTSLQNSTDRCAWPDLFIPLLVN